MHVQAIASSLLIYTFWSPYLCHRLLKKFCTLPNTLIVFMVKLCTLYEIHIYATLPQLLIKNNCVGKARQQVNFRSLCINTPLFIDNSWLRFMFHHIKLRHKSINRIVFVSPFDRLTILWQKHPIYQPVFETWSGSKFYFR